MKGSKPITVKPPAGGALLSALSEENVGIRNYTIKRNWRRFMDREIRSEGFARFCPKMFEGDIPMPASAEDITLAVMLRHPNGRTAVVVGTPTTLWSYTGLEDPLYIATDYFAPDYYSETAVAWKEIGTGFSAGRRWEVVQVNGYLVLNNAVDLPMTFRLTDDRTYPIYELREMAVASVGSIAVFNSVLHCFDIAQIKETQFAELMAPIPSDFPAFFLGRRESLPDLAKLNSGVDGVAGNTMTATGSSFNASAGFTGMEGRKIRFANGTGRTIVSVTSPTVCTVDGIPDRVEPALKFYIDRDPLYSDYFYDFCVQEEVSKLWPTVNFASTPSNPDGWVGLRIWWESGDSALITGKYYDSISGHDYFIISGSKPIISGPCVLESPNAYGVFTDESSIDRIRWRTIRSLPNEPRRFGAIYPGQITPSSDIIQLDYPVKSIGLGGGDITVTGMVSGNLSTRAIYCDGYRIYCAAQAVTSFYSELSVAAADAAAAESLARIVVDQTNATLTAAKSALDKAQTDSDAAPDDAALSAAEATASAAVDAAQAAVKQADSDLAAAVTASDAADAKLQTSEAVEIQLSDAVSTISRLDDLEDDGSAILRALPLRTSLVIYKETSIFLCRQVGSAFTFSPPIKIPVSSALFYRNTLIDVGGNYHLYAAENQFIRFDMTNQLPISVPLMRACQDRFFDNVSPNVMEQVFAVDNQITAEIYFAFPSTGSDRALAFEYEYNTMATSSIPMTAGATVSFPGSLGTVFLIGGSAGMVYRHGMVAGKDRPMAGTASKASSVITASSGVFAVTDIGKTVRFASGARYGITSFISATQVTVVGSGTVAAQGFSIEPVSYHFDGANYESILQSGGDAFGAESSYKKLNRYNLMLSTFSPNTPVDLVMRSGGQANAMSDRIVATVTPPQTLIAPLLEDYFLSDRLEIDGMNNPIELTSRVLSISGIRSDSFGRRST